MNKKILFLILLAAIIISPTIAHAALSQGDKACVMVKAIKDALLYVGTTIVIIGWVVSGILYLTSGGSPEKTGLAKKALIAAVIGTVLIIIAPVAYEFVNVFTGGTGTAGGCG